MNTCAGFNRTQLAGTSRIHVRNHVFSLHHKDSALGSACLAGVRQRVLPCDAWGLARFWYRGCSIVGKD